METHAPFENGRRHSHIFDEGNPLAERNTRWVVVLTALMMIAEIAGGWTFNSMALLADGWHMSSHALALGLSAVAYRAARRFADDHRFTFGTWKIEVLAGYTSALFLILVAALMLYQSVERLIAPTPIHYDQAIAIAVVGLLVNVACAWLLRDGHGHHHHAHQEHEAHDRHHDLNLRSAYTHVLADAATSVLAIVALTGGKLWGAAWLDPVMGIVGAGLVAVWATACCEIPAVCFWTLRWMPQWSRRSGMLLRRARSKPRFATYMCGASARASMHAFCRSSPLTTPDPITSNDN